MNRSLSTIILATLMILTPLLAQDLRPRDYGINIGIFPPGPNNAITDVPGVSVGHVTLIRGDSVNTGVTAILPHRGNVFREKLPAAVYIANGFGKLTGIAQIEELGNIESPVILTNTLAVSAGLDGILDYVLSLPGNENVRSVNAVVGETNDGGLNDIRGRHVTARHVLQAIGGARPGPVEEGNVGAGAGTQCLGFKGGIGTASRILPSSSGGYTIGVLTQTNFGGMLLIDGVPVGRELRNHKFTAMHNEAVEDGSCMVVVITDAPLCSRDLKRLAKRASFGIARTGGIAANGSGDFIIAISTAEANLIKHSSPQLVESMDVFRSDRLDMLFQAAIETCEEAIVNSLFAAKTVYSSAGMVRAAALPVNETIDILKKYKRLTASDNK